MEATASFLKRDGLKPFLWTQFLGAFNDNSTIGSSRLLVAGMAASTKARLPLAWRWRFSICRSCCSPATPATWPTPVSKRTVLIATKSFEIVAMAAAVAALLSHRMEWMLGVLFLLAHTGRLLQPRQVRRASRNAAGQGPLARQRPARDEHLRRDHAGHHRRQRAAGRMEGRHLEDRRGSGCRRRGRHAHQFRDHARSAFRRDAEIPPQPLVEIAAGLRHLWADRPLYLTVVGISYFWFLGALLQMNLLLFGRGGLGINGVKTGIMVASLAIGIGVGSMAAGRLSGDKVEPGLVPLGSFGMGVFGAGAVGLPLLMGGPGLASGLGFWGGLFIVPLYALLQQRSGQQGERAPDRRQQLPQYDRAAGGLRRALAACTNVCMFPRRASF